MNFDMADFESQPWLPWQDQSTADAYHNLCDSFKEAVKDVREDEWLNSSDKVESLRGVRTAADFAFKRYGGVPGDLFE